MPPKKKDDASKKSMQKKKASIIEDKTFGLKNKNKSKKVQQHIKSVERNVLAGDPKLRKLEEQRKAAKANAKLRKKAAEDEQNALFGAALLAITKKKTTSKTDGKMEAKGRDHDDENTKKVTSRAMKMMFQMDAQEMDEKLREDPNYVPTLEDEVELERQKLKEQLKKEGKTGTPVTPESFAAWQDVKRKRKLEAQKKMVEAEFRKKKGGKGLSVLSGRALYEYRSELFRDDDFEDGPEQANGVDEVAAKVQSNLFLQGDDDDLDDLDDDE